ncbi:restriction endonuclease subunit S [Clostridium perfringens]
MSFKENKWNICFIGDVADILNGYAFKAKDFQCKGVPIIKIKNIVPPNISIEDVQYVSRDLYNEKIKYALKYNDILISMTGSGINQISSAVGKIGRVRIKDESLLLNQRVGKLFVKDKNKCDEDYLYYYMTQNSIRYDLASSAGGSANQANISPAQIKSIKIILPPLEEQKAIAKILSDLDEKIEVNNKINKNLEEMAQAIFKQWFVDFEFPNEEGKPYKSSGGEMVESELGMIPKDWEIKNIEDFCEVCSSKRIFMKDYVKSGIPFYRSKEIIELSNGNNITTELYISNKKFNEINSKFGVPKKGDILLTSVGTLGISYLVNSDNFYFKDGNLTWFKSFIGNSNIYIYSFLSSFEGKKAFDKITIGSTQKALTISALKKIKLVKPTDKIIDKYTLVCQSLVDKIEFVVSENRNLEKLRDTLLPKLMSGEIRVPLENNEN